MTLLRSPNPKLAPTMIKRLDALQEELDHTHTTGEVRIDELQRRLADVVRETAIPAGIHHEKIRQGIVSPNIPKTPIGSITG